MDADAATSTGATVAKRLASCNKSVRERALHLLKAWLSAPSSAPSVTEDDLLKIWKGLFYCVWHADKLPVQLDLINRLASLLLSLDPALSARYFDSFLVTIRREWSGIDHLRLDKFYLLIRRFFHHLFLLLSRNKWQLDLVERFVAVLEEKSLLSVDKYPAQGVNYHISQVFLEEISSFFPEVEETWNALLGPFITVLEKTPDKVLIGKIRANIFDVLLENGVKYLSLDKAGQGVVAGSGMEKLGKVALLLGLSKKFFDCASKPDTAQGCRKHLFALHEKFLKLEKDLESSGIQVTFTSENVGLDSGCASAVDGVAAQASDKKQSKKNKKDKKTTRDGKKSKSKNDNAPSHSTSAIPINVSANNGEPSTELTEDGNSVALGEILMSNSAPSDSVSATPIINSADYGETSAQVSDNGSSVTLDEIIMSNLQRQFELAAAEAGMMTPVGGIRAKKRKRAKSLPKKTSNCSKDLTDGSAIAKSGEKSSVKRVSFSMKNNIVWKPHSPLPPQSVRLPPSTTPRGSALKKGVPPGPVRKSPPSTKKIKVKSSSVQKARKTKKSLSPSIKAIWKLQEM